MNSDSRGIIKLTKKLKFENYKTLINKVKKNSFDKKIIFRKNDRWKRIWRKLLLFRK